MNLRATVYTDNHINKFPVDILQSLIVQQQSIGSDGKPKLLLVLFLHFSTVLHQLLYHLEIHHGLPTKKVHFQIFSVTGVFYKKLQCFFTGLQVQKTSFSLKISGRSKAITASQVTVMGGMEAHGLNNRLTHHDRFVLDRK